MDALFEFSSWMQAEGATIAGQWLSTVREAATSTPALSLALLCMPVLTGLLMRSLAGLVAAAIVSAIALTATAAPFPAEVAMTVVVLVVSALLLFAVSGLLQRRSLTNSRRALSAVQKKNAEIQTLLDREIRWRMAAEKTE